MGHYVITILFILILNSIAKQETLCSKKSTIKHIQNIQCTKPLWDIVEFTQIMPNIRAYCLIQSDGLLNQSVESYLTTQPSLYIKKIKLIVITIAVALHSRKQDIVTTNVYWLLEQMSEHEHSDVHGNLFLKQEHWLVLQSPLQPHLISSRIALGAGGIKQWVGRRTSLSLSFVQPFSVRGGSFNDYDDHKPKPKSI